MIHNDVNKSSGLLGDKIMEYTVRKSVHFLKGMLSLTKQSGNDRNCS